MNGIVSTTPKRWFAAALCVAAIGLAGCASEAAPATAEGDPQVTLSVIKGSDVKQVQLSADAIGRLGVRTTPVRALPAGVSKTAQTAIPYSAIVYDDAGETWTFVNTAPRTYVREPIAVESIVGNQIRLTAGPKAGTPVVITGSQELLGAEYEISGEE